MTTYMAVAWMARAFYFNNIDREIAAEIQEGKVAIEMIRPYNYLGMKTMQALEKESFVYYFSLSRDDHCCLDFSNQLFCKLVDMDVLLYLSYCLVLSSIHKSTY